MNSTLRLVKLLPVLLSSLLVLGVAAHSEAIVLPDKTALLTKSTSLQIKKLNAKAIYKAARGGFIASPLICSTNEIYIVPSDELASSLVFLDLKGQQATWAVEGSVNGPPFRMADSFIGVVTSEGKLLAVDRVSKTVVFERQLDSGVSGSACLTSDHGRQVLLFALADGHLVSIDPGTGKLLSKTKISDDLTGTPVLSEKFIAVGSTEGMLYWGTDRHDPKTFKSFKTSKKLMSQPAFGTRSIYVGTSDGLVYSVPFDAGLGIIKDLKTSAIRTPIVVDDGETILVADADGRLHLLDQNLEYLCPPLELGSHIYADMTLSPDKRFLAIPTTDGECIILNLHSGVLAKISGFGPINAPIAFGPENTIYVVDNTGELNLIQIVEP